MKEKENKKENKSTTYSGDSIASKWLSGTWLGNLLGYGNNSYTDGYGTTRQFAPLKEDKKLQILLNLKNSMKLYFHYLMEQLINYDKFKFSWPLLKSKQKTR